MLAVGMLAAILAGRSIWLVPASFVLMMVAGGALGMAHIGVPFVEIGIALSVAVFGLAIALRLPLTVPLAMVLVGCFAVFHGHAHGGEMPSDALEASYAIGFVLATALLHAIGVGAGLGVMRLGDASARRVALAGGAALFACGLALLAGSI